MPTRYFFAVFVLAALSGASAQTTPAAAKPGQIHCSLQPGPAPGDALNALVAGNAAEAERLYTAQLNAGPLPAAYAGVVRAQLEQNKLAEAVATANAAVAAMPRSAAAQAMLGDAEIRSGLIPEAFAAYTKALELDPCSARAHLGTARVDSMTGHHGHAAQQYGFAHTLSPTDPDATALWLEALPADARATPLHAFLGEHPALPPERIAMLSDESARLDQHKLCSTESTGPVRLPLTKLLLNGRTVRSYGLTTRLNGNNTFLLELDSTVPGIVLSRRDADKAGVHPLTTPPATPDAVYTAVADRLTIGSIDYHDCPVRVVPDRLLAGANSVIGTDFFRDRLIHIDYVDQSMTLTAYSTPGALPAPTELSSPNIAKAWSPAYIDGPAVLIPTLLSKKGPFLFALDTGINRSVLSPIVTKEVLGDSTDASASIAGVSGSMVRVLPKDGGPERNRADVFTADKTLLTVRSPTKLPVFRFTNNEYPDPYALSFDITPYSHTLGTEVSGLLGFNIVKGFFLDIDYRDSLVRIQFDINRRYQVREFENHF